eukprot:gene9090-6383_t
MKEKMCLILNTGGYLSRNTWDPYNQLAQETKRYCCCQFLFDFLQRSLYTVGGMCNRPRLASRSSSLSLQ